MRSTTWLLGSFGIASLSAFWACGTDNGTNQTFGPNFSLDGGNNGQNDSSITLTVDASAPDSAVTDGGNNTGNDGGDAAASCTNVIAVVAGGATTAFGATYTQGAWKASSLGTNISGTAVSGYGQSVAAVVPFGAQFLSVMRTADNSLKYTTWTAGTWSQAAAVATASARDTPSLTVLAGKGHLVFQGTDFKFVHGTFTTNAWDSVNDPVGGASALQSFGPSSPQVAAVGTGLVAVYSGDSSTDGGTGGLYDVKWSTTWGTPTAHPSPLSYYQANPAVTAIASGALDALVVWVDTATRMINWTGRVAAGGTYTAPAVVSATALSNVGLSLIEMANGKFALVFWGQNNEPYFTIGTQTGQAIAWSTPAALVSGTNPVLTQPPTVAPGVCGDDAVAAYAQGGSAFITRLRGTTWTAPEIVTGVTGATSAGVATH